MSARIACVGVGVIDQIYAVPELPSRDIKLRASSCVRSGGGMAAGAAVAAARLGGTACWIGRVGDDGDGRSVLARLKKQGVNVRDARVLAQGRTASSVVLVDCRGNRAVIAYGGADLAADPQWLPLARIRSQQAVLADIRWAEGAIQALSVARAAGIPAVLDVDSSDRPAAIDVLRQASHAVFSQQGLEDLFDTRDPDHGLRQAAGVAPFVAVTLGARGVAWLGPDDELRQLAAPAIRARETLGAGDVFHGAFTLALAEGQSEEAALRFALHTASLKCTRVGGWASFPDRAEVEASLEADD